MARGDQIYVMRPLAGVDSLYQHHGIDCGDGTVIHYYKPPGDAVITRTSYEMFARGNPVYTKQQATSYVPDIVIERAESRLGERQYNLLTNNCEHFATWCKIGQSQCVQLAGIDVGLLKGFEQRFLDEATQGNPVVAMEQLNLALGNVTIAQSEIQAQLAQAQKEMDTWQRAAQLALKQGKESLARAALERRYPFKKKVEELQQQLDEVRALQQSIEGDRQRLKLQITD
jgi:Lecithin retinol acyltransferase/PspA/IM30 family